MNVDIEEFITCIAFGALPSGSKDILLDYIERWRKRQREDGSPSAFYSALEVPYDFTLCSEAAHAERMQALESLGFLRHMGRGVYAPGSRCMFLHATPE